jgi:hypothetical protein
VFIGAQQKQGPAGGATYVLTGAGIGAWELLGAGSKDIEGYGGALDDGWTDGWTDGWADGWADGSADGSADGWAEGWDAKGWSEGRDEGLGWEFCDAGELGTDGFCETGEEFEEYCGAGALAIDDTGAGAEGSTEEGYTEFSGAGELAGDETTDEGDDAGFCEAGAEECFDVSWGFGTEDWGERDEEGCCEGDPLEYSDVGGLDTIEGTDDWGGYTGTEDVGTDEICSKGTDETEGCDTGGLWALEGIEPFVLAEERTTIDDGAPDGFEEGVLEMYGECFSGTELCLLGTVDCLIAVTEVAIERRLLRGLQCLWCLWWWPKGDLWLHSFKVAVSSPRPLIASEADAKIVVNAITANKVHSRSISRHKNQHLSTETLELSGFPYMGMDNCILARVWSATQSGYDPKLWGISNFRH